MNCILQKRMWLAGASLLAIVLGSGDANAVMFGTTGGGYLIPSTGWYDFRVAGSAGGTDSSPDGGGIGALVGGELFLAAGETLDVIVGGEPSGIGPNASGGGGGGGSFVFGESLLFAAGGGAGANISAIGGNPGRGYGGHPSGAASYGGAGGGGVPSDYPLTYRGGGLPAQGGFYFDGGQGAQACFASGPCFPVAPNGGYGGGGGGGYGGGGAGAVHLAAVPAKAAIRM